MTEQQNEATGEYQPLAWQIVTDAKGFQAIHETDEDGNAGDLVANVWGDHANLIVMAPLLRQALINLLAIAGTPINPRQDAVFRVARTVLASAQAASA